MLEKILKFEYLFLLILAVFYYWFVDGNWILFVILFLTPDISMFGYLIDKKVGAVTYNMVHNYILAVLTLLLGFALDNTLVISIGTIFFAHVSFDRFLGYGLKEATGFRNTHLGKIGK